MAPLLFLCCGFLAANAVGRPPQDGNFEKRDQTVASPLRAALNDLHSGRFFDATKLLSEVVRIDPRNRIARCALGEALMETSRAEKATTQFLACADLGSPDPKVEYELGEAYLRVALEITDEILSRDSTSPYARRVFAENYLAENDWKEAETQYQLALAAQPHALDVALSLGVVYLDEGRKKEASELYRRAVQWFPASCPAHYHLAEAAFLRSDAATALAQLRTIQRLNPEFLPTRPNFPDFPVARPEFTARCSVFRNFVSLSSPDSALQFILSACYPSPNQPDSARLSSIAPGKATIRGADSSHATEGRLDGEALCAAGLCGLCQERLHAQLTQPQSAIGAFMRLGQCAFEMNDLDSAFRYFKEARDRNENGLPALYWTQECARRLAQHSFEQIVQIAPGSYLVHLLKAQAWEEQQKPELAIREYQVAVQERPDAVLPRIFLGHLEWKWMRYDAALADLQKALTMAPSDPTVNYLIGDIFVQEQRPHQALPYLRSALAARPGFLNAEASLGRALVQLGDLREAAQELEKAASADRDGSIHYELFRLYLRLGNKELAAHNLARAQELHSQHPSAGPALDGPLPP
jgi:tetratricopeptide (TPR) repeat protein